MTEGDKDLLLIDLCARTLYGVICLNKVTKEVYKLCYITSYNEISLDDRTAIYYSPDDIIPYLRPMSSMTKDEEDELDKKDKESSRIFFDDLFERKKKEGKENLKGFLPDYPTLDWLNQHHFDYRDLIGKGLALPAPEGMYEKKI